MTIDQRAALATFRTFADPLRLRVTTDPEGWPVAPGRYGQLEWHAEDTVAIYSTSLRVLDRLLAVPGVRRHQMGDQEYRLLLPVPVEGMHQAAGVRAVAALLRVRRRRVQSERQKLALDHGRQLFQAKN